MIWHLNANDSEYDQVNEDILSLGNLEYPCYKWY